MSVQSTNATGALTPSHENSFPSAPPPGAPVVANRPRHDAAGALNPTRPVTIPKAIKVAGSLEAVGIKTNFAANPAGILNQTRIFYNDGSVNFSIQSRNRQQTSGSGDRTTSLEAKLQLNAKSPTNSACQTGLSVGGYVDINEKRNSASTQEVGFFAEGTARCKASKSLSTGLSITALHAIGIQGGSFTEVNLDARMTKDDIFWGVTGKAIVNKSGGPATAYVGVTKAMGDDMKLQVRANFGLVGDGSRNPNAVWLPNSGDFGFAGSVEIRI